MASRLQQRRARLRAEYGFDFPEDFYRFWEFANRLSPLDPLHTLDALDIVLAESRVRDTLTLWHLLSRVNAGDRARVYDRIAALTPVPAGVSRERALELDRETLRRWREELAWTW